MSVAFSPAAHLGFTAAAGAGGRPGSSPGAPTTAPRTAGSSFGPSHNSSPTDEQRAADARGAAIDRRVTHLLDANAPVFFEGSDALPATSSAAAAAAASTGGDSAAPRTAETAPPLGTPSLSDRAVTPTSMLANYSESSAARDLLLQTLSDVDRKRLRDLHHRWRATAQRGHRTTHAVLFMCLQPGGDPPEHPRISPRAKLEAWIDAPQESAKLVRRGADAVIEALEHQYRGLYREVVFRRQNEATIEDARAALQQMRRKAEGGRLLIHYNGHGMPSITANGELWFFDARREHFVPFNIIDISAFAESPTVYVIDCNNAASALNVWRQSVDPSHRDSSRDVFLCACGEDQTLPTNPVLPADFFTSCLTTPLRAALLWYEHYSDRQPLLPAIDHSVIDQIPGDENNKKTPRGELAFILAAVADTVAWCTVDPLQFYALFRQDMMLRSLLRNFLIADRLMRETGCTPRSHPPLPYHAHLHPAWQAWDVALEGVLAQVPGLLKSPNTKYTPSPFWRDQLSSFEVGLSVIGSSATSVPEQLPCVVLALGQTAYRTRALLLLARYFEQGTVAVHHGLACGVMGYIVRLLGNREHTMPLLCLWLHLLRANPEVACAELVRAGAESMLVWVLTLTDADCQLNEISDTRNALPGPAPFVLSPAQGAPATTATTTAAAAAAAAAASSTGNAAGAGQSLLPPAVGQFRNSMSAMPIVGNASFAMDGATPPSFPGFGLAVGSTLGNSPGNRPSGTGAAATGAQGVFVAPEGLTLPKARTIAAFLLCSMINAGSARTAVACWNAGLVNASLRLISDVSSVDSVSWGCLLLGRLCELLPTARKRLVLEVAYHRDLFSNLLSARHPAVRASAANVLGKLLCVEIESLDGEDRDRALDVVTSILKHLLHELHGVSTEVRVEIAVAVLGFIYHQRQHCDDAWYREILAAIESGVFPSAAGQRSTATAVPTADGSQQPQQHGGSMNSNHGGSSAAQFRVLEMWRRVSVHSRLAAGSAFQQPSSSLIDGEAAGSGVSGGASDQAASGARQPSASGAGAVQLDCPALPVPSRSQANNPPSEEHPPLSQAMRAKVADLVHDAAIMAHTAAASLDVRLRAVTLDALTLLRAEHPQCPMSNRVAREGNRLALALDREARHTMSDTERCSARRNIDLMRLSVLRADDTCAVLARLGQQQQSGSSAAVLGTDTSSPNPKSAKSPRSPSAAGGAEDVSSPSGAVGGALSGTAPATAGAAVDPPMPVLQPFTLPVLPQDTVITATALRELEPQAFSADTKRVLSVTDFEKLRSPTVTDRIALPSTIGSIVQVHVVNDLSSSPLALCVGSTGACMVLNANSDSATDGTQRGVRPAAPTQPRVADPFLTFYASSAAFNAVGGSTSGGPSSTDAGLSSASAMLPMGAAVTSAYRSRDSMLFFSGVQSQIRCFSLAQEALEQVLSVPGTGVITALFNTPTNEVFAGRDDGTVKIFDTRQNATFWSFAGAVGDAAAAASARTARVSPRVINVSRSEASPHDILVAQTTCIRVYDARKRNAPKRTIDLSGPSAPPSQLVSGFGASLHLPYMVATLNDGTVFPLALKGVPATEVDVKVPAATLPPSNPSASPSTPAVSAAHLGAGSDSSPTLSGAGWGTGHVVAVHPHRPLAAIGKNMVVLTPDESRLVTSLAI